MEIQETKLQGCFSIMPQVFEDNRGYFFESYNYNKLREATGIDISFYQDNQAKSMYGVIRGLHLQRQPYLQTKLVRVLSGKIIDVAVDVRKNSPTYGEHVAVALSSQNNKQLFVPQGFAHGYAVLSKEAVVAYKCDSFYHKESEDGIYPFDLDLSINWCVSEQEAIISEKDKRQMLFKDFEAIDI